MCTGRRKLRRVRVPGRRVLLLCSLSKRQSPRSPCMCAGGFGVGGARRGTVFFGGGVAWRSPPLPWALRSPGVSNK